MGRLDRTRGVGVSVGSRPGTRSWDDRRRALVVGMGWHDWGPGLDCLCLSEGVPLCRHEKEKRHNAFRCEPPPRRPSCLPLPFLGALSDGFLLFSSSLFLVSSVPCHPLPPGRSTQARTLARTTTAAPSTSRGPLESRRGPKGCVGSLGSLGKRGGVNKKTGVDGWMDVVFSPGCVELRACVSSAGSVLGGGWNQRWARALTDRRMGRERRVLCAPWPAIAGSCWPCR